ncbi:LPS ABC transporter substrate-binding protein LptA [Phyllobacterium sp. 21LDTY02-6]|jgi:lipopolysaccharide export system protein LptA|uniref:LptA/OstA family protein n=1 Tax=unclassified Phyllobacterium TaxID=2638441 RepID=UPI0020229680|nr:MULTISPECIES: LptA/OstA family protein [unclassified Phyllobacterium]MCO4317024.1 LPS ABC transporter substrate-binding protein LptA [Phyllobacterium sp. 21LDTY02-6]MCX8278589.1 LPS ABC transporter substrate-binding protein LptA [Phyllobacterium sp. 0TCS1.6C]MCX8293581.1 LPS ABC transporter substrate-binding protein LptA [Phyllobacterium sp. 0TCS1.6A]
MSSGVRLFSISSLALGLAFALAMPATAQQNTTTAPGGIKLSGDQPIQIDSDKVVLNNDAATATFTGNVTVTQGPTLLKAGTMVVYYIKKKEGEPKQASGEQASSGVGAAGSQDIDHLEVSDKVYVKSEDQVATGDKGTFDMKTEVLVLTGSKVVLSQGDNVAVGCKLTAQLKTGQAQLESCKSGQTGRVSIVVAPNNDQKN